MRDAKRGFTLIEVMVALVVVSLGMLGVIQAVGQTASNSTYLRDKTLAHWVAMNKLTEVRLQKSAPPIDKSSDEAKMGGRDWRWTMTVTQSPVETIRRIDISVREKDADENSSLAFVSGFYGTAIAPAGSMLIDWQGTSQGTPGQQGEEDTDGDDVPGPGENPDLEEPPIDPQPPEPPEPQPETEE
ncbi:MAG: type II secretion system minor pseudopilin GspI [Steroidobacteraceae bacterium]